MSKAKGLTKAEYLDGWVEFSCPDHGFLGLAPASFEMWCGGTSRAGGRCNQSACKSRGRFSQEPVSERYAPLGYKSLSRFASPREDLTLPCEPLKKTSSTTSTPTPKGGDNIVASETVAKTLKKYKKGLTIAQLVEKTGLSAGTVRATVTGDGFTVAGTVKTGQRGRPASVYAVA